MKKEFYDMRFRAPVIFFIMLFLFIIIAPLQYYSIESLRALEESSDQYLEKFVEPGYSSLLANWSFYMYSQWFGKNFGQLVPLIAIVLAFPLFSRENENGTLEFLLVRQSRQKVFINKAIAGLIALFSILIVLSLLPTIYSLITSKDFINRSVPLFSTAVLLGGVFWFCITLLFSILFNDQVKPILASLGILGLTTLLGLLKPLSFLNTYNYIFGIDVFKYGSLNLTYSIVLALLSLIFLFAGYMVFKNKEV